MSVPGKADKYYFLYHMYAENLIRGHIVTHPIEKASWTLDFALSGTLEINGIALPEGFWRFSYNEVGNRKIQAVGDSSYEFLSLVLNKNPYVDSYLVQSGSEGRFNQILAYPIFKIISCIKNPVQNVDSEVWISNYIGLLINQLKNSNSKTSTFKYSMLKDIYMVMSKLEHVVDDFPQPAELVRRTGIPKSQFQNACLTVFGQSAQKIVQHLKMTRAFNLISIDRETITNTSTRLRYKHSPNFITSFHDHFAVTPMEILQTE